MSEKEWDKFFDLLDKIVNCKSGETWKERALELRAEAESRSNFSLGELMAWSQMFE